MSSAPSVLSTVKKELFSLSSLFFVFFLGFLYICFSVFLLNYRIVMYTATSGGSFDPKIRLLISLLGGIVTGLSTVDFVLLLSTATLVGYNILLLTRTIYFLRHQRKVKISIGGATVIALVTTGCASCGLSLLSILGLSASLSFLPFRGMELHIGALILLIISLGYMVNQIHESKYCKLK